ARAGMTWPINYVGPASTILTVGSDALAALSDPSIEIAHAAENPFHGSVVLLGGTFKAGRDISLTPHGEMPGVEVHANVANMLTTRRFIRPSNWLVAFAINAGVDLVAGRELVTVRPFTGTLVSRGGAGLPAFPAGVLHFRR